MAREASITQEQVNAAADSIRAAGGKPTARAVREQLGTGSMATVLKLLQAWHGGQVQPAAQAVTLPPTLTRALVDFIAQEVAAAKAGLETELAEAQKTQADLIAENERQALTIEAQAESLDLCAEEKAAMAGKLGQMESELAAARDEALRERQAAEAARTDLAKAQLRLEAMPRLEAELERIREALAIEKDTRAKAEQEAAVARARLEEVKERYTQEKTQAARCEATLLDTRAKVEKATQDLLAARLQAVEAQARADVLARELKSAQERLEAANQGGATLPENSTGAA